MDDTDFSRLKGEHRLYAVPETEAEQKEIFMTLQENREKIKGDRRAYYDPEADRQAIQVYYEDIDFGDMNGMDLAEALHLLVKQTHTNPVGYSPSRFVYPWVDLQENGSLVSVYSGRRRKPEEVLAEDYITAEKRKQRLEKQVIALDAEDTEGVRAGIENEFKFNCEHAVPQSWFGRDEPMKGDIHHLFTCDPVCNSARSNYPYYDFKEYEPETDLMAVRDGCGKAEDERFEPEFSKGTVARAMLYFLLRYPDKVKKSFKKRIDIRLLNEWHREYPPDVYEKHRNAAIADIQGNRNPFIDYPEYLLDVKWLR
ncbi:endonuclease I family protein [Bacillus marinisedimentorum]|uniref:endonuclease I family protein n=1 Tax=Bacillus marinisedimentorum TaxID=1821260 RepID=UPI0007DE6590|nr:endonuclease [Bacillus marinisedimentorum]